MFRRREKSRLQLYCKLSYYHYYHNITIIVVVILNERDSISIQCQDFLFCFVFLSGY
jgi:hypothetical protein